MTQLALASVVYSSRLDSTCMLYCNTETLLMDGQNQTAPLGN